MLPKIFGSQTGYESIPQTDTPTPTAPLPSLYVQPQAHVPMAPTVRADGTSLNEAFGGATIMDEFVLGDEIATEANTNIRIAAIQELDIGIVIVTWKGGDVVAIVNDAGYLDGSNGREYLQLLCTDSLDNRLLIQLFITDAREIRIKGMGPVEVQGSPVIGVKTYASPLLSVVHQFYRSAN